MKDPEAQERPTMFQNFYADYYTMAGIAVASSMALLLGKYSVQLNIERSETLNRNFSIAFSIIGMFSSHAVSNLSIFFCAEITPTVIRGGGVGLVLASAGFGLLTAPIMELHNQKGYFLHHIIFACCTLICIICILLLPETRYQPLPETLADGEGFSRQPLLPPRKLGAQSETSRDYTRVRDTPLREAPAAAVGAGSAMDSTASSAVDLTAPSVIKLTAIDMHRLKADAKDPNGRSYCSLPMTPITTSLDKDRVVLSSSKESLLSSTPLHRAPRNTDPLLSGAEEPGSPSKPSDITAITQLNGNGSPAGSPVIPVLKPCPPSPLPGVGSPPAVQPLLGSPLGPPVAVVKEVREPAAILHSSPTLLPASSPPSPTPPPPASSPASSPPPPASTPPPPPLLLPLLLPLLPLLLPLLLSCLYSSPSCLYSSPSCLYSSFSSPSCLFSSPSCLYSSFSSPPASSPPPPASTPPSPPPPASTPPPPASTPPSPPPPASSPPPPASSPLPPAPAPAPPASSPSPSPPPGPSKPSFRDTLSVEEPAPVTLPPPPAPPASSSPPLPKRDSATPPPIDSVQPPQLDSPPPPPSNEDIRDVAPPPSPPAPPPPSPPTCTPPSPPPSPPVAVGPAASPAAVRPVTDIVAPEVAEPSSTEKEDEEEKQEQEEEPISLVECTVSSPIDSGVLPLRDSSSTENRAVNGELSS
ncbi:hypothetical protein NHX12_004425 [Muraenolepis orangiensis]|uniref:Major facilitator superfamily (MFS) profile domain-containing protein n=1 Tax=Muraenolepis orangiensis TaxID=630683 RepID=A0A9Q0IE68_9TELE|nr:hypothetical protein NHX12_004425 [Muraenolepis orangiensis]